MSGDDQIPAGELGEVLRDDPEFGFRLLHEEYGEQILRRIKYATGEALDPNELRDAYQETLIAVLDATKKEGFDPDDVMRLVNCIAERRGLDMLRLRARKTEPSPSSDVVADRALAAIADTDLGFRWAGFGPAQRKEFREVLRSAVAQLPPLQRDAALAFIENFESMGKRDISKKVAEAIRQRTGEDVTVAQARSRWRFAREALAKALRRRGFLPDGVER